MLFAITFLQNIESSNFMTETIAIIERINCGFHALREITFGVETGVTQSFDAPHRTFHIPKSASGVANLGTRTGQVRDNFGEIVDRRTLVTGDVKNAIGGGLPDKENIRGYNLFDINEIPRLLTVTEYREGLMLDDTVNKGEHGNRIPAVRILTRPENTKVTQTGRCQPAFASKHAAIELTIELRNMFGAHVCETTLLNVSRLTAP